MKMIKTISIIALLISGFVSIDLGLNCIALAVPELQDGIGYHSFLQSIFGLLEDTGIDGGTNFFYAFRTSIWITYAIFVENIFLSHYYNKSRINKQQ